MTDIEDLPFKDTHFRLTEASYFLERMAETYHKPAEFLFNLNAFIQAIRNTTFILQSEPDKPDGFEDWYASKQEEMRASPLLRNIVQARNTLVKQSSLTSRSEASSGLFRGRMLKLTIHHDIPVFMDTQVALDRARDFAIGTFLDEGHSAIGEQVGVKRTWIVDELGDQEVFSLCVEAFEYMRDLMAEALTLYDIEIQVEPWDIDMDTIQVLLETDIDPSLVEEWGW